MIAGGPGMPRRGSESRGGAGPRRRLLAGLLAAGATGLVSGRLAAQGRNLPAWLDKLFELLGVTRPELGADPNAFTDDQYSVLIRERIYLAHIDTFSRKRWPFPLQGSVHLRIEIDARGKVALVRVLDSTGYPILRQRAEEIVRASVPFPLPPAGSLRRGRAVIVDTIVFDNDGQFAIKSVAERMPKREEPSY